MVHWSAGQATKDKFIYKVFVILLGLSHIAFSPLNFMNPEYLIYNLLGRLIHPYFFCDSFLSYTRIDR